MASEALGAALAVHATRFSRELTRARRAVPEGVHQARVASRRLREAIGALDGVLPAGVRKRAARDLRSTTRALGAVRECDVTLARLREEAARHRWPRTSVGHVAADLVRSRSRAHAELLTTLRGRGWRAALTAVARHLSNLDDAAMRRDAAASAVRRRRTRAAALVGHLEQMSVLYVPDRLHAVRLSAKKLRYALDWERDLGRRAWARERRSLEQLQDLLGEWHDLLVLQERIHRLRRSGAYPRLTLGDFKQMAGQLERDCRAAHARILKRVPFVAAVAARAAR